ncbi:hypothetical protein [Peribacillus saganii]|uniref:hypothetical protein n=1 Tax=Peribacillus saganii TaxID=2303992 RepID=UPI001313F0E0|nr:hypothetical protein [Peribacillus saganii]
MNNQSQKPSGKTPPGEDYAQESKQNKSGNNVKQKDLYKQMGDNPEENRIKQDNENA